RPMLLRYVIRNRRADGSWPAFWWRSCKYSTYWNLHLLQFLGYNESVKAALFIADDEVSSAFDLSFVLGISSLARPDLSIVDDLVSKLLGLQLPDGRWPGAPNLRVTHHECYRPWERPVGALYIDTQGLISTASAIYML